MIMDPLYQTAPNDTLPDISFVMPCYNEEDVIGYSIPRFVAAFRNAGLRLELVAVDNGSRDQTGAVIRELAAEDPWIVYHRVQVNEGYGKGVLSGLPLCRGHLVGIIPCDDQVEAQEVVRLCEIARKARTPKIFKVRRRFRLESFSRRMVSRTYNLVTTLLFGNLNTMDINAGPKLIPRQYLQQMRLQSTDWFLDAEIMIKAKQLGLGVFELNVFSQMRAEGKSNVRPSTCWEFVVNLLKCRFGPQRSWRAVVTPDFPPESGRQRDGQKQGWSE